MYIHAITAFAHYKRVMRFVLHNKSTFSGSHNKNKRNNWINHASILLHSIYSFLWKDINNKNFSQM